MLRMTDNNAAAVSGGNEFINIDQKKRQITFLESSAAATSTETANDPAASADVAAGPSSAAASLMDRAPMVSAPKIFAFDGLFTSNDPQVSIYLVA